MPPFTGFNEQAGILLSGGSAESERAPVQERKRLFYNSAFVRQT